MSYPKCYDFPRMNKHRNQFTALSEQDRDCIRDLCSKQPYDEVVRLLSQPRSEGGLGISTSKAALCRFFTTQHAEPSDTVLAQIAAAANVRHEQRSNAFLGAIRASVQARVFENLSRGKALADMEKDFRLLKTAESLYLADASGEARIQKAPAPLTRILSIAPPRPQSATSLPSKNTQMLRTQSHRWAPCPILTRM